MNLWSMIIHRLHCEENSKSSCIERLRGEVRELGKAQRFHHQELTLVATEDGWCISVFGCDGDGGSVIIDIPASTRKKVRVVDSSRITWRHDLLWRIQRLLRV